MAFSITDKLRSGYAKVRDTLDQDKTLQGFQLARGGLGARAFNTARIADNTMRNNLQRTAGTRSYGQALGKSFLDTPQSMYASVQKTAITRPFGNLIRATTTPFSAGAGNYIQGVNTATTAPTTFGKIKGGFQALKGGGQVAAGINPWTYVATTANTLLPQGATKRALTGGLRGYTQTDISPETQSKNINTPLGSFDPVMGAGQMVGFVKNPVNARLFKSTESILPTAQKTVGKWLGSNALRGSIEQIALDLPDMPEGMNTQQKAAWLTKTMGVGAVSELVGQGVLQGGGKVLKNIQKSKLGKITKEQAGQLFDTLATVRRRNFTATVTEGDKSRPMIAAKLQYEYKKRFPKKLTLEEKKIHDQMGYSYKPEYSEAAGALAGAEPYQDEDGNWRMRFNPEKAALGVAAMGGIKAIKGDPNIFGNVNPVRFDGKYKVGDIGKLQKALDEALGTESFNNKGKWTSGYAARQTAKQSLEYDAQSSPEARKLLEYVNGLEKQIAQAQQGRKAPTGKDSKKQQLGSTGQNQSPIISKQQLDMSQQSPKSASSGDSIAQGGQDNLFIPKDKLYIEGKPLTKMQQNTADREWEQSIADYANGITRNSSGGVSVEANFRTKNIQKAIDQKTQLTAENKAYKEWQKSLYGEYNLRTTSKAIDDLATSLQSSTDEVSLGVKYSGSWKDKPKILLSRETMDRNFEDIMGADAPIMKKKYLEPVYKAEADRTRFLNKERADISALGIKPRSKESELLQLFGEKQLSKSQLKKKSPDNYDKIIEAEKVLRGKYEGYLEQLNKVLVRNGYDPIPKRADYFHHFQDISSVFGNMGVALKATDLPTDINGLSADFKPGKTFFSAALKRRGPRTTIDAITGIDRYLDGASNQIYHTDNIKRLRNLEAVLREKYAGTQHLSNFAAELTEYTNVLAGKKAMVDRAAESVVGRKIYAGANAIKRQVGANMVGMNVASAMTNYIPVAQTIATTNKKSVAQAGLGILRNVFKDDGFIDKSNFLTTRIGSDRLSKTKWEQIGDKTGWLFKTIDSFTSQLAVRSKYLEGIQKGLSEADAMSQADSWARKTLAGRGAGEMPTLFNSKTLGLITQFQLEVNNQISFMSKDIPRAFDKKGAASALAQLFIYNYIFNEVYEKATGRRPAFDPIGVAQRTYEDYTNPRISNQQATNNLIGNVSDQLPFSSVFTGGRIPIGSAIPDVLGVAQGKTSMKKELLKIPTYLLPPTGGGQVKKTIEGVGAFNRGYSQSPSGAIRFPVPQTPANRVRTALFGQWSTPEAQQYIREGQSVLGEKQSQVFKAQSGSDRQGYYDAIMTKRQAEKNKPEKPTEQKTGVLSSLFGSKKAQAGADSSAWDSYFGVSDYSSLPETTNQQKAIKEDARKKIISKVMTDEDVPTPEKLKVLSSLGETVSEADASYYQVAALDNSIKTGYVLDEIGSLDDTKKMDALAAMRVPVLGKYILSDEVIDELYNQGIVSSAQKKYLKSLDYDKDPKTGKVTLKKKKSGGRGKKLSKLISDEQVLSAYKNALSAAAPTKTASSSATLGQLLNKRRKSFKLKK